MQKPFFITFSRLVTQTFFRHIEVTGHENVPDNGPVVFAGNHPNALMDGWLMTANSSRWPLYFLANAKLWKYRLLASLLNATGAVPVYRREEHDGEVDNESAFARLYELLERGDCVCIFPEGISHIESQLVKLKTGTARIALTVAGRGKVRAPIVPCGLNYIHRHRFRSQVLLQFGEPIHVDDQWLENFRENEQQTVLELTEHLARELRQLTVNAPDWRTVRIAQTVRRLYKPSSAKLTPSQYIELNRRFVSGYLEQRDDPELRSLTDDVEDYQASLDMLGLKDHQLRKPIILSQAIRKLILRTLTIVLLLPLAIPGALLHLPIGWIAATVGDKLSYDMDDIATLKVFATILLLPALYLLVSVFVGSQFGFWWGLIALFALPFSFLVSVRLIEAEVGLIMSILSVLRLGRYRNDVEELRKTRADLVERIRKRVDRMVDPELERVFSTKDFAGGTSRMSTQR
jgi:glycerol-3-phosphate O-acyltransferase/dihydroxyacetone phosphate acyltransferase